MSHFSSVDDSPDPSALVASLDASASGLGAMKAYMARAASLSVPGGRVLDLGCGVGHDLLELVGGGLSAVGLDPSTVMLEETRRRVGPAVPLVRGDGSQLPFRESSFDGCRIERVLQHTDDPGRVIGEAARVVRPGGFLAAFEPDWVSWEVSTAIPDAVHIAAHLHRPRQPDIGRRLPDLVDSAGFDVADVVTESSVVRSMEQVPVDVERGLARAVAEGRVSAPMADAWLAEQRERDADGQFQLRQAKVLVVAHRRH